MFQFSPLIKVELDGSMLERIDFFIALGSIRLGLHDYDLFVENASPLTRIEECIWLIFVNNFV